MLKAMLMSSLESYYVKLWFWILLFLILTNICQAGVMGVEVVIGGEEVVFVVAGHFDRFSDRYFDRLSDPGEFENLKMGHFDKLSGRGNLIIWGCGN